MLAAATCGRRAVPLGLVGIALIGASLLMPFDPQSVSILDGHPGLAAVFACVGTSTVLYVGLPAQWLESALGRAAVYLGDISYSIYLIHFPVIVLYFYVPFEGTVLGDGRLKPTILLIGIILALSVLSFRFLEKSPLWKVRPRNIVLTSASIAVLGITAPGLSLAGWSPRMQNVFAASSDRAPSRCGKLMRITHPGDEFCIYRPAKERGEMVMLVGDSHSDALKQSFVSVANKYGIALAFAVRNNPLLSDDLDAEWLAKKCHAAGRQRRIPAFCYA